jgi:hypothetical protein
MVKRKMAMGELLFGLLAPLPFSPLAPLNYKPIIINHDNFDISE